MLFIKFITIFSIFKKYTYKLLTIKKIDDIINKNMIMIIIYSN